MRLTSSRSPRTASSNSVRKSRCERGCHSACESSIGGRALDRNRSVERPFLLQNPGPRLKELHMRRSTLAVLLVASLLSCPLGSSLALADGSGDSASAQEKDGKNLDKAGNPTFKVEKDGTVDWYTN